MSKYVAEFNRKFGKIGYVFVCVITLIYYSVCSEKQAAGFCLIREGVGRGGMER